MCERRPREPRILTMMMAAKYPIESVGIPSYVRPQQFRVLVVFILSSHKKREIGGWRKREKERNDTPVPL
jgi:hypothetical protein